jgi:hypothetical protein
VELIVLHARAYANVVTLCVDILVHPDTDIAVIICGEPTEAGDLIISFMDTCVILMSTSRHGCVVDFEVIYRERRPG